MNYHVLIDSLVRVCGAIQAGNDPAEVFAEYYRNRSEEHLAQASAHSTKGLTTWAHNPGMLQLHQWHLNLIRAEQAHRLNSQPQ